MTPKLDKASSLKIESLLEMGLDFYGLGRMKEAITCWEKVLLLDSENETAQDYLRTSREPGRSGDAEDRKGASTARILSFPENENREQKVGQKLGTEIAAAANTSPELDLEADIFTDEAHHSREALPQTFDEIYRAAMVAYVRRDLERARRLFEHCLLLRPNHQRALHNLKRLKRTEL